MKVLHVSASEHFGGAARACQRIHEALITKEVDSWVLLRQEPTLVGQYIWSQRRFEKLALKIRGRMANGLKRWATNNSPIYRSAALPGSNISSWINRTDFDVVNLHWINGEMTSIEDIGRIDKPLVWTLHDMWPFLGCEHYSTDQRYVHGYEKQNDMGASTRWDIDRWAWHRKRRRWRKPMNIVAPSRWMANCAMQSKLMSCWPINVIPYPIDTDEWKPQSKRKMREKFGIPLDASVLIFGAFAKDSRKGIDLLQRALSRVEADLPNLHLMIFGHSEDEDKRSWNFPVHYLGMIDDQRKLVEAYSAADAKVIPSRLDNLPNTGLEAAACGLPILGFAAGGLPDIIEHEKTGYLAKPFHTESLAEGIRWILAKPDRLHRLSENARDRACQLWSVELVSGMYLNLYRSVLADVVK